jgi:hypothetical protein
LAADVGVFSELLRLRRLPDSIPASFRVFPLIVVQLISFVVADFFVVDIMDQWRERLLATRALFLEDDEEDDFNVNWMIGLGLSDPRGQIPSIVRPELFFPPLLVLEPPLQVPRPPSPVVRAI